MTKTYNNKGVCSRSVTFDIAEDGTVTNVSFMGGCNGNLKGVAALAEGRKAEEIIKHCKGITCGFKSTSCPDQFAQALEQALAEM
ncbi:MAG: TIGR03905 family TSCPD domain-containing protein [Clostridia bacterium]|nr:TIGR03905 family TSCPD domain-containing protein [Clostridia bacterium]MBO7245247.1 TIGR03905 family TSCPD domain-containing protein [Clostridia bacterium]